MAMQAVASQAKYFEARRVGTGIPVGENMPCKPWGQDLRLRLVGMPVYEGVTG
jgi:hypothetical protein